MMRQRRSIVYSAVLLLAASAMFLNGCVYLKARGRDACEIFDVGITFTKTPQFGLYMDYFNIIPLGYSKVDGKVLGFGNRQIGLLDFTAHHWGVLAAGESREFTGEFNPKDPHLTRADQRDVAELPTYNTGLYRMNKEGNVPPKLQFVDCQRVLHLGWIGVHLNCRPLDLLDFILGWTTLDILGDDKVNE